MADKCKKITEQMNMYIDNDMTNSQQEKFLDHIASCERCRDEFNSLKFMLSLAKEIDVKTPPMILKASVMEKIRQLEHEKSKKPQKRFNINRPFFTALSTAAACLAVIVVAYVFIGGGFLGNQMKNDDMAAGMLQDQAERYQQRDEEKTNETFPAIMEVSPGDVSLTAMSEYLYDIRITVIDQKSVKEQVSSIIKRTAGDEYDQSTLVFNTLENNETELIINIGKESSDALVKALSNEFNDITIIGKETDAGPVRIIIANP